MMSDIFVTWVREFDTINDALGTLSKLRRFIETRPCKESEFSLQYICALSDMVDDARLTQLRQTSIFDFFGQENWYKVYHLLLEFITQTFHNSKLFGGPLKFELSKFHCRLTYRLNDLLQFD